MMTTEKLNLTQGWDKTFPKSGKANHSNVTLCEPLRHHAYSGEEVFQA